MKKFLALLSFFGFSFFWSCHLGPEAEKNSFDVAGDTAWTKCDTLDVSLLDGNGQVLDILFHGKLASLEDLSGLDAAKYPGGTAKIRILGHYKDGSVCVDQTRTFEDGGSKVKVDTVVDPSALPDSVIGDPSHLSLVADGAPGKVKGKVVPAYVDQGLYWTMDNAGVASLNIGPDSSVGEVSVKPEALGEGFLLLRSRKDAKVTARVRVRVSGAAATAVFLDNDSLSLFAGGPRDSLQAVVSPFLADPAVVWSSQHPDVVSVDSSGLLIPLKAGTSWVKAVTGNGKKDSALIVVLADVPTLYISSKAGAPINEPIAYSPKSVQKVGHLVHYAWDLAGDGTWDDSLPGPWFGEEVNLPSVSAPYATEGIHHARFRVRDSEGNEANAEATVDIGNQAPEILALRADTSISIFDSIPMTALVRDLDGGVAWVGWDYEGDGLFDDTLTASDAQFEFVKGHKYLEAGNYLAVFKTVDGNGKPKSDTARIKVEFDAPVADAGVDTSVIVNSPFTLHLKGSDHYGRILKREIKSGDGGFVAVSAEDTTLRAPSSPTGLTFVLRVTDDDGLTDTDTVQVTVILSANADLSALALSAGSLVPAFNPGSSAYSAQVTFADSAVSVTPTVSVATASITVNGAATPSGAPSAPLKLQVGPNPNAFAIVVTSPDGSVRNYAVSVTRQPNAEATLKTLSGTGFTLRPVFAPNVLDYLDTVAQSITSVTLRPTTAVNTATVTVNGAAIASGTPTPAIPLTPGDNLFTLVVTAQDGATKTTYRVKVVRRAKLYIYRKLGAAATVLADSAEFVPGLSRPISSPGATGFAFSRWSLTEGSAAFADSAANPTQVTLNSALVRAQATFTLNRYTITGSASGCGTIQPAPGTATYDHGANVAYTLTPSAGCRLSSVRIDGVEEPTALDGSYAFTGLSAPHTLAAVFVRSYTLSGTAGQGGTITPSAAITVDSGSNYTYVIAPDNGKKVFSLKDNGATVTPTTAYALTRISANHVVEVVFAGGFTLTGTVLPDSIAGTITPISIGVDSGVSQTFTFKPKANYRYVGLLDNGVAAAGVVGDTQYTLTNVSTAHALHVRFLRRFSLTVTPVGCGGVNPGSSTVDSATTHAFTFTPLAGCKVDSLYVNGATVAPASGFTVTAINRNTTLRVVFTRVFSIATTWGTSGNNQVGGSVSPANPSVDSLEGVTLAINPNPGYRRSALTVNGNAVTPVPATYAFASVTQAGRTLHATFTRTFSQTASVGLGSGTITPGSATVDTNGSQGFAFNPANANYRFHSLLLNGGAIAPNGGTTGHTLSSINRDNALQARFWRLYTVTVSSVGCGTVNPGTGLVDSNSTPAYAFTLPTGCSVDSLYVDGAPVAVASGHTFSHVLSNRTLRVVFSQGYTVATTWGTVGNNRVGGSITPDNPGVISGGSVTLQINPATGYRRQGFTVDGTPITPVPTSYTITNITTPNRTAHAVFHRIFSHSASVYWGQGTITPASAVTDTGVSQIFAYAAATDYRFDTLRVNGAVVTPNPGNGQHAVLGIRDNVVTIRFRRLYTISVTSSGCGSVTPGGQRDSASNNTFNFTPITGCKVDSVFVNTNPVAPVASHAFNNLSANQALRVVFTRQFTVSTTWSVTGTQQVGGNITPANPLVDSLDPVVLNINPGTGYRRYSLTVNGNPVATPVPASITLPSVTGLTPVHAQFRRVFRVTASAISSGGSVGPAETWVDSGVGNHEVVIRPEAGWAIDTVFDNKNPVLTGGTVETRYPLRGLNADHDVTANFIRVWDLTVVVEGEGKADPTNGTMEEGADQVVRFEAAPGYILTELLDNGEDVTKMLTGDPAGLSAYTISRVAREHTLRANFRRNDGGNTFRLRLTDSVVLDKSETPPKEPPQICARWEGNGGTGQQCAAGTLIVDIPMDARVEIEAQKEVEVCQRLGLCNAKPFVHWLTKDKDQDIIIPQNRYSFGMTSNLDYRAVYDGSIITLPGPIGTMTE